MQNNNKIPKNEPAFLRERTDEYFVKRIASEYGNRHPMKSRIPGPGAIQMRTNDYLCLAKHPKIIESVVAALHEEGFGNSISRVWMHNHNTSLNDFEHRIASLMQAEDGVLCASGYSANVGLIQAIAKPTTPIYIDMFAHLSLWEGVTSAKAKPFPFRHNNMDHLERLISKHGPGIVVVDALYSSSGHVCDLENLVKVSKAGDCVIVVDETHSFGAQGPDGAGLVVAMGLAEHVHFRTVGLSKVVASRGGIVVCSERNAEFIRFEAFPAIFSTSVLPHEVAGYNAVLNVLKDEGWRQDRLTDNHAYIRKNLSNLGYNVEDSELQIISLESGTYDATIALRDALECRGVFGAIFFPPASPKSRCSIRFTVNCGLMPRDLERIVDVCEEIREEVDMQNWRSTKRRKQPEEVKLHASGKRVA